MSRSSSLVPVISVAPPRGSVLAPGSFLAPVADLGRALLREWSVRRDVRAVEGLDDASLADLGLRRGEVEGAVRYGRGARASAPAPTPTAPLMGASWTEWR